MERKCKQCGATGGSMLGLSNDDEPAEWICLRHVGMFSVELRRIRDLRHAVAS